MDVFNLLVSYGSSIQHKCVSSFKISNSENNQSDEELTKPTTLLFRLCKNDNIPGAKLNAAINNLTLAGYNLSTDTFLKMESHPAVAKLKEDNLFYKSFMTKMTSPSVCYCNAGELSSKLWVIRTGIKFSWYLAL